MIDIETKPDFLSMSPMQLEEYLIHDDKTAIGKCFDVTQNYIGRVLAGKENPVGIQAKRRVANIIEKAREVAEANWEAQMLEKLKKEKQEQGLFGQGFVKKVLNLFEGCDAQTAEVAIDFFQQRARR